MAFMIAQMFGSRRNAANQKAITSGGTGDVNELTLALRSRTSSGFTMLEIGLRVVKRFDAINTLADLVDAERHDGRTRVS